MPMHLIGRRLYWLGLLLQHPQYQAGKQCV